MKNMVIVVQVVDVTIFDGEKARKNIKGRVTLSDGVSKVICMLPEKTYNAIVRAHSPVGKIKSLFFDRLPKTAKCESMMCGSSTLASKCASSLTVNRTCV